MPTEASFRMSIRFDHPVKVWVLQLGGWLPIQFTGVNTMLIDRCVLIATRDLALNPERSDMQAERWWLQQLDNPRFALNAILCAAEGWNSSEPTFETFVAELADASGTIAKEFPQAAIVRHDPVNFAALYETVSAARERHLRECAFLSAIAHLLCNRVAAARSRKVERQIVDAADANSLARHSMVVLAALSCLYEPQHGEHPRIGRGVLKLTPDYTIEQIYNALADIRSLEYLAAASGLPGGSVGFCTRDKALAAFWTYLGLNHATWEENSFSATYMPQPQLFPRLPADEVQNLLTRLR